MNWIKLAYHSFLTIVLGVTLSVCSNVMETDDFEIEAIANSNNVKYGSANVSSGTNAISFSNSFTNRPIVNVIIDNSSGVTTGIIDHTRIMNITTSGFDYKCCDGGESKIYYTAIGN
jgi:hypothetical protein